MAKNRMSKQKCWKVMRENFSLRPFSLSLQPLVFLILIILMADIHLFFSHFKFLVFHYSFLFLRCFLLFFVFSSKLLIFMLSSWDFVVLTIHVFLNSCSFVCRFHTKGCSRNSKAWILKKWIENRLENREKSVNFLFDFGRHPDISIFCAYFRLFFYRKKWWCIPKPQ